MNISSGYASTETVATPLSNTMRQKEFLDSELETLHDLIDALHSKLRPVLIPTDPHSENSKETTDCTPMCDIAGNTAYSVRITRTANMKLKELIHLIDL